jgi:tetratricopeptide (TPR) repeat protein
VAAGAEALGAEGAPDAEAAGEGAAASPPSDEDPRVLPTREEAAALRQVAELRAAAGQLDEAVTPLRRVMRVPTRDAALLALAAKVFLGTGNYAEAFRYATALAALDPADMNAKAQAVESQYRMGQVEAAMRAAEAALKAHPGDLAMLVELGTMQVECGPGSKGYGEALAQALKLKPDYVPALYLSGRKAQLEGDFKDAETAFAKVVKLDPGNFKALGQLGMAQYHLGKSVAAEASFRGELARNPADYNTWYNLGELLLGRADEETNVEAVRRFRAGAMECYLKAIDLNPDHAQARYRVGVLLIGNGQYKEAIRHLEAALRLDGSHVPTLVQLSVAYERLKRPERARAYLDKAYELDPLNKIVLARLRRLT